MNDQTFEVSGSRFYLSAASGEQPTTGPWKKPGGGTVYLRDEEVVELPVEEAHG